NRDEALKWARKGLAAYPDDPELLAVAARLLFSVPGSLREDLRAAARDEGRELARKAYATPPPAPAAAAASLDAALAAAAGAEAARLLLVDAAARYDWTAAAAYLARAAAAPGFEDRALAALVLRKGGDWAAALAQAEAWYRERPESEAAAEAYARALVGVKSDKAAQELLARLLAAKGSPAFRSSLHYLQSLLQKSDEAALPPLRSALVENADNGEALAAMCDIYYRRKDYQKARFYLKQALSLAPGDPELARRQRELDAAAP
ncbi:MAG: tetratricopeptide repeat protein, partial [Spirochaetaceae bacterium]|nr:tetratricopeptide repeat protein [Spirochaetaceae bacterium]